MRLIFIVCHSVLGIIFILFTRIAQKPLQQHVPTVAQVVSRCLSPRRPGFNARRFLVVETVALGQCNPSTSTVHCQYHSTVHCQYHSTGHCQYHSNGPSMSFTYHWHNIISTIDIV
jgi:hypothetical protein